MNLIIFLVVRLYKLLMRLYPRSFYVEFADEMTAVFAQSFTDALEKSRLLWLVVALTECADVILAAGRQHWHALTNGGAIMDEIVDTNQVDGSVPLEANEPSGRSDIWVASLPFILSGLYYVLKGFNYDVLPLEPWLGKTTLWYLVVYVLLVAGLSVSWAREFPRWAYSFLGMALMQAFGLFSVRTYGFRLFGYTFTRDWGWRALLPLIVMGVLLMLFFGPSPLVRLVRDIRRDWTRLSFVLYSALSWLLVGVNYDNKTWYSNTLILPLDMLVLTLITTLGACFYMRANRTWQRAAAFQVALLLIFLVPRDGSLTLPSTSIGVFGWLAMMLVWSVLPLLPGIPALLRSTIGKVRPA